MIGKASSELLATKKKIVIVAPATDHVYSI